MGELECLNEIKGELFGKGSDDKKKKTSGDEEKKLGESTTASSQHYPCLLIVLRFSVGTKKSNQRNCASDFPQQNRIHKPQTEI